MQANYELVALENHGEWYLAQLAREGRLCEAFWVHKSIRDQSHCRTEGQFLAYLCAQTDLMLEQFGDIRQRVA